MTTEKKAPSGVSFLDMQAHIGITKHVGGIEATDELLSLCHITDAHEVLNVGCGIGVGSAYIANKCHCRVVGVDISEQMIAWSRRRAREERVEDRVDFRTADVLDLPFAVDQFDVVFAESVLVFVEDKARAIQECVRVTRPGGYVGLNEGLWIKQPPPELVARVKDAIGPFVPTSETWQALWEASGLQERVVKICRVDARTEVKSRVRWVGWRWLLGAWGRGLRLYITNPAIRQSIKEVFDVPPEVFQYAGYGLFAGKK
jgi:ubiquinone/menaquinone biosynthesis C-methylase UbiE